MENKTFYKVPAENLDALKSQIETLNRRVARLVKRGYDVQPIIINVGEMYVEKVIKKNQGRIVVDDNGNVVYRDQVYANVKLVSPKPPKAEGWGFVAALTHVDDVGTVLRVVPGAQVEEGELKRFRNASPDNCEHCHMKRKRNDTFILRRLEK